MIFRFDRQAVSISEFQLIEDSENTFIDRLTPDSIPKLPFLEKNS